MTKPDPSEREAQAKRQADQLEAARAEAAQREAVRQEAARVEAATRDTGDDLLVTSATRDALTRPLPLVSRGTVPMKGKAEPVEVLAFVPSRTEDPVKPRAEQSA